MMSVFRLDCKSGDSSCRYFTQEAHIGLSAVLSWSYEDFPWSIMIQMASSSCLTFYIQSNMIFSRSASVSYDECRIDAPVVGDCVGGRVLTAWTVVRVLLVPVGGRARVCVVCCL